MVAKKKKGVVLFFCQENKNINGFEYVCIGGIKQQVNNYRDLQMQLATHTISHDHE